MKRHIFLPILSEIFPNRGQATKANSPRMHSAQPKLAKSKIARICCKLLFSSIYVDMDRSEKY